MGYEADRALLDAAVKESGKTEEEIVIGAFDMLSTPIPKPEEAAARVKDCMARTKRVPNYVMNYLHVLLYKKIKEASNE